jgi:hypothetical protein
MGVLTLVPLQQAVGSKQQNVSRKAYCSRRRLTLRRKHSPKIDILNRESIQEHVGRERIQLEQGT